MTGRVAGKVALITGSASGIGAASARLLVAEGSHVIITDRNLELGMALADELGEHAVFRALDVSQEADWVDVIAFTTERFSRMDILVNNAGLDRAGTPEDVTLEDYRFVNSVLSEGVMLGCKHGIGLMKATGGSIINISSIANYGGFPSNLAYGAAKGAVRSITKSVAVHCIKQKYSIRCNSVHPGFIRTPLMEETLAVSGVTPEELDAASTIPLARAEDVAPIVLFLGADESALINGAEIVSDGGFTILPRRGT